MRAPRRVPWGLRVELEELYELLFSPSSDATTRQRGLSRINVYLASPSCPAFLPLLHGLMTAASLPTPSSSEQTLLTRMSCAMAIVRFVNGMVDPLQTGGYARPITHLAATIGIPPILISIRHRATHDDLPPLPLLLTSVNMAIDYLHHYAFLPLLASSSDTGMEGAVHPGRVKADSIVKRWKRAMKIRIRDKLVGDENETGREIKKIKRELEVMDPEDVVSALITVEGLIPLARRKRPADSSNTPAPALLALWGPFLAHLASLHPSMISVLVEQGLTVLFDTSTLLTANTPFESDDMQLRRKEEGSARWCLATWLLWIWNQDGGLALKEEDKEEATRRVLGSLLSGDSTLRRLWSAIVLLDPSSGSLSTLDDLLPDETAEEGLKGLDDLDMAEDLESQLAEMQRRLQQLEETHKASYTQEWDPSNNRPANGTVPASDLPTGWRRIVDWKECPIGSPIIV